MVKRGVDRLGSAREADPPVLDVGEPPSDHRFRLTLDEILPGADGEVVLFNDSALREVVIVAPSAPVEEGTTDAHVTAEGVDVGGYRFLRFGGIVLFHHPDTIVTVEID